MTVRCDSKLTENDVIQIRRLYHTGRYSQELLSLRFKVSQMWISRIVRGLNHKKVKHELP